MSDFPTTIQINEEGPREGFQIERAEIPTEHKIELIDRLSDTGLSQIQVVSFVNPKQVPGMADAEEVVNGFRKKEGVRYTGLWLNEKGLMRALTHKDRLHIKGGISLCASEAFLRRNQNRTFEENAAMQERYIAMYKENGVAVERGSVMAAFGCNFQGDIPVSTVLRMVDTIQGLAEEHGLNIKTLSLADTMAWATPQSIHRVVGAVREAHPDLRISLHLHDTRGMGVANAYAGLEMGVEMFDAAVAGLGGCPFAGHKGAAGNVCTEDLAFMCHEMGIETGLDLEALIETARFAEEIVSRPLPGSLMRGGTLDGLRSGLRGN